MLKDIVIIGAGGVGRETALIIEDINEANKKFCSHEGYLLEGKRHSMKERKKEKNHMPCVIW